MPLFNRPDYLQTTGDQTASPSAMASGQTATAPFSQTQQPEGSGIFSFLGNAAKTVGNFGVGLAKSVIKLPQEAARLGKFVGDISYAAVNPNVNYEQVKEANKGGVIDVATERPEWTKAHGTAQSLGETTGDIAQFFLPGKLGLSGAEAMKYVSGLSKVEKAGLVAKVLPRLAAMGTESAGAFAVSSLHQGEITPETVTGSILQGAFSQLGKIPNAILGTTQLARGAKDIYDGNKEQGVVDIGLGLLALRGAMKQHGVILDKPITGSTPQISGEPTAGGTASGFEPTGNIFQKLGKRIQMSQIKPTKADVDGGFNINNVSKYEVGGNLDESWTKVNERIAGYGNKLKEIKAKHGDPQVIDLSGAFEATRAKLAGSGKSLRQKELSSALDDLEQELNVFEPNWRKQKVAFTEGWEAKAAAGDEAAFHHDPTKAGTVSPKEGVFNEFYSQLRQQLETNAPPQYAEVNKALSELIPIRQAMYRRIPVEARNSVISLNDVISGSGALINPAVLPLTLAQRALRSGQFGQFLTRMGGREAPPIPGEVPNPPDFPKLPAGQTTFASESQPYKGDPNPQMSSQAEIVNRLREMGFQGPLTQKEIDLAVSEKQYKDRATAVEESKKRLVEWMQENGAQPKKKTKTKSSSTPHKNYAPPKNTGY